jgi:hypothetical protein
VNRLEIGGRGPGITVKVDDHLLACSAATLELDAENIPRLTVKLPVADDVVITLDALLGFEAETKAALMAMGWTPPEADGG